MWLAVVGARVLTGGGSRRGTSSERDSSAGKNNGGREATIKCIGMR